MNSHCNAMICLNNYWGLSISTKEPTNSLPTPKYLLYQILFVSLQRNTVYP